VDFLGTDAPNGKRSPGEVFASRDVELESSGEDPEGEPNHRREWVTRVAPGGTRHNGIPGSVMV